MSQLSKQQWNDLADGHAITSLGKFEHGYVMYVESTKWIIDQLYAELEALQSNYEAQEIIIADLKNQLVEHSEIAHRALLIGDTEGWFEWKGGIEDGGNYSSLERDLKKIRDKKEVHDLIRFYTLTIDAYKKQIEALQAPKTCDGCKYEKNHWYDNPCDMCVRTEWKDYYEPKDIQ